jgi:phenol 2-monooxygenase
MPKSSQVDVLIIGAGPAGLVCANAVARAGLTVRIIDHKAVKTAGHADGVMPRTTEIIQSYGLGETFLKQGNQVHTIAFYNARDDGSGISVTNHLPMINEPTARYPHAVCPFLLVSQ